MSIKQAIEALELAIETSYSEYTNVKFKAAIAALRSMPQGEPVAWRISDPDEPDLGSWLSEDVGMEGLLSEPLFATPHTEAVRMSEAWISVDERLPEPFTDVLISPRPTDYCCEGQVDHKGQWTYSEYNSYGDVKYKIQPRYWMPLPSPPVEQATAARLGVKMGDARHADQA